MKAKLRIADAENARPIKVEIKFNKENLERVTCPPTKDRIIVWDSKTPKLCLVVTRNGSKTFCFYGRVRGGRGVRISLGRFDEISVEQARKRCIDQMQLASSGEDPVALRRKETEQAARQAEDERLKAEERRNAATVAALWEKYRTENLETTCTPATRRTDVSLWNVWLSGWAHRIAKDITPEDVHRLHQRVTTGKEHIVGNAKKPRHIGGERTANKVVNLVRRIYNFGKVPSPVVDVKWHPDNKRVRYFDAEAEFPRFWKALHEEQNATMRDALLMFLLTGARKANVVGMKWEDVNLNTGIWTIPASEFKTGHETKVPLSSAEVKILKARRKTVAAGCVWVFPSPTSKSGHIEEPRFALDRVLKAANISDFHLHDFRHNLGSWMDREGATLQQIGAKLGHRDHKSTARYTQAMNETVRQQSDAASNAMLRAGKGGGRKSK